jgi:hypothetical protein
LWPNFISLAMVSLLNQQCWKVFQVVLVKPQMPPHILPPCLTQHVLTIGTDSSMWVVQVEII